MNFPELLYLLANWNAGGSSVVNGGLLTVDGAYVASVSAYMPKQSLEFAATFQSAIFQNIGFASDAAYSVPWITIGQGNSAGTLYARSDNGTSVTLGVRTNIIRVK